LKAAIAVSIFAVLDRFFADPLNFKNEMIQQRPISSKRRAKKDEFVLEGYNRSVRGYQKVLQFCRSDTALSKPMRDEELTVAPRYIVVDALANETGIRDEYSGCYLAPEAIGISTELQTEIADWLVRYEKFHIEGYSDHRAIDELDEWGERIANAVRNELKDCKVSYYSDARLTKKMIE